MDWTTMSPQAFGLPAPGRPAPRNPLMLFDLPAVTEPEADAMGTPPLFAA